MTYCVAMKLRDGLVFVADSPTNAGVDNIATFRKLHLFRIPGGRLIVIQSGCWGRPCARSCSAMPRMRPAVTAWT